MEKTRRQFLATGGVFTALLGVVGWERLAAKRGQVVEFAHAEMRIDGEVITGPPHAEIHKIANLKIDGDPEIHAMLIVDVNSPVPHDRLLTMTMERELILEPGATIDQVARIMVETFEPSTELVLTVPAGGCPAIELNPGRLEFAPDFHAKSKLAEALERAYARIARERMG